jgi:hypothetical protein
MFNFKFDSKEKKDLKKSREVWTTEKLVQLNKAIEEGYTPKNVPFWEGDPRWRAADINFQPTQAEKDEIKKCMTDIVYFANTYCHVMTDYGIKQIKLHDYQEEMLRNYQYNRHNIVLSSRQIGKCCISSTDIYINNEPVKIHSLYKNKTFLHKVKSLLYTILDKLE